MLGAHDARREFTRASPPDSVSTGRQLSYSSVALTAMVLAAVLVNARPAVALVWHVAWPALPRRRTLPMQPSSFPMEKPGAGFHRTR